MVKTEKSVAWLAGEAVLGVMDGCWEHQALRPIQS